MLTILHNPRCSKSRQALELLQQRQVELTVIDYQKHPLSKAELASVLAKLGIPARALLRTKEDDYKELQLDNPTLSDDVLMEAMLSHPKLMERPVVFDNTRAVIGRPPEQVLDLLA
ncbi:arsenate reductase (glutaredoxin) [Alkalimonas sp. MEB108]|uniref:Arsenate reductase n=1 Tax=Alkalimonas cellulosilytica TaxID=3058395 RepID=A0ABU7J7A9_9GAMM|nr:arsenate reductase (glutaredoxin) [Alkalimonas sp. MEB108]MEE2002410.1 arsenate reductase (glutaredoxin) [Alkalimonas sp. MEB108]